MPINAAKKLIEKVARIRAVTWKAVKALILTATSWAQLNVWVF